MLILAPNAHVGISQLSRQRTYCGLSWLDGIHTTKYRSLEYYYYWKKLSSPKSKREVRVEAFEPDTTRPSTVEMEPIKDCGELDQILLQAQDLSIPILIDWMATWCRKCIYLKPKLEKLAVEFGTKIKFYCVDVNNVPQSLVKRGNISKMPTIQLWKDGEMKAEVIGGHKAWLVIEEVRKMIKKFV